MSKLHPGQLIYLKILNAIQIFGLYIGIIEILKDGENGQGK